MGETRVLPPRELQPAPRASSPAWVCPRAGSSPADTGRPRFCRDPRRPSNRSPSEPAPPPGPPTPRPQLGRRPATHLSAVQPETLPSSPVPGSGISAPTRRRQPGFSGPPATCSRQLSHWPQESRAGMATRGQTGPEPRCAPAASRSGPFSGAGWRAPPARGQF